jgi:hypothetical protein
VSGNSEPPLTITFKIVKKGGSGKCQFMNISVRHAAKCTNSGKACTILIQESALSVLCRCTSLYQEALSSSGVEAGMRMGTVRKRKTTVLKRSLRKQKAVETPEIKRILHVHRAVSTQGELQECSSLNIMKAKRTLLQEVLIFKK